MRTNPTSTSTMSPEPLLFPPPTVNVRAVCSTQPSSYATGAFSAMLFYSVTVRHTAPAQRNLHCATPMCRAVSRPARWTRSPGRKERGTALIFALVMLLLLTILGITAITTSSLQETMAGNMRDQYMAQQAGDSILFDGQSLIFNQQTKSVPSCPPDPAVKIWDSSCLP